MQKTRFIFIFYLTSFLVQAQITNENLNSQHKGMEDIIEEVVSEYIRAINKKKFICDLTLDGSTISGFYSYTKMFKKKKDDIRNLDIQLMESLLKLRDKLYSIKNEFGLIPYKMTLTFDEKAKYNYKVYFPDLKNIDLSRLKGESNDSYPDYIYINLTKPLIKQLDDFSLNQMIPTHIEEARKILQFDSDIEYSKSISTEFYLLMLNIRVEGEISNGQFNQLYSNFSEYDADIIIDIYKSFELLGNNTWIELIKESIQLYSHIYGNVEEARKQIGLKSIERQNESDIMERFYSIEPNLDKIRSLFVRKNIEKFEKLVVDF